MLPFARICSRSSLAAWTSGSVWHFPLHQGARGPTGKRIQTQLPPLLAAGDGLFWSRAISTHCQWLVQKWECNYLGQWGKEEIFLRTSGGNYPCSPEAALGRVSLNMAIRWVPLLQLSRGQAEDEGASIRGQSYENNGRKGQELQDPANPKASTTSRLWFCEPHFTLAYKPVWVFCCLQ